MPHSVFLEEIRVSLSIWLLFFLILIAIEGKERPQQLKSHMSYNNLGIYMQKKGKIILWPVYFDSTKTRTEGRKIPKGYAIQSPRIEELEKAVQKLGLQPQMIANAAHSKEPWRKTGLLMASKSDSKTQIMRRIAKMLQDIRAEH